MIISQAQHETFVIVAIYLVLIFEVAAVLMAVFTRSLFGFFTTLAALCGTITAVLTINAARDWSDHFKFYKSIKGVDTWRTTDSLFWYHIDPAFIEGPFYVAVLCAIAASITFAVQSRHRDAVLNDLEEFKQSTAGSKRKPRAVKKDEKNGSPAATAKKDDPATGSDSDESPSRTTRRKSGDDPEQRTSVRSVA